MVDYQSLDDSVLKQKNMERVTSVEKFEQRSWDRDEMDKRLSEVQSNVDTIETILDDLNEQLSLIPSESDLMDEWSGFIERIQTDSKGQAKQLPRAFFEAEKDRSELLLRQAIWQARVKELERFTRRKLSEKFGVLLNDHRALKSDSSFQDLLDVQNELAEIRTLKAEIEKFGQALREENKSLWNMAERLAEEDSNSLSESELDSIADRSIERFVKSDGVFTLDQDELESDREVVERDRAADSAADSVVESEDEDDEDDYDLVAKNSDGVYILRNRGFEDRVDVICRMWDDENIQERVEDSDDDITKSEISDMTDVSQATLFNSGLFEKMEKEKDIFLKRP